MVRSIFWGRRKSLVHCLDKSPYLKLKKEFGYMEDRKIMKPSVIEKSRLENISKHGKDKRV